MATEFKYQLTFAGIPFCLDEARLVRIAAPARAEEPGKLYPEKYQPEPNLVEELNRLLPREYLIDFLPPRQVDRNLNAIARTTEDWLANPQVVRIGEWYYPTGASRWSVFRGLATSSMVKEMVRLALTANAAQTLIMKCQPLVPQSTTEAAYTVSSSMYMLPPRPLAEHGAGYDGLFLVTLVDERWYWQYRTVTLRPGGGAAGRVTWGNLIDDCASALGISPTYSVGSAYLYPEPDSQLYALQENAPRLMDALAYNIGRTFVRKLDGSHSLLTDSASSAQVDTNRGAATTCIRTAGGDIFSTLQSLPAKSLATSKNAVLPATIRVHFPIYVEPNATGNAGGDVLDSRSGAASPVPYFLNSRYANKRPSAWYEASEGGVWTRNIALNDLTGYSGLSGQGTVNLADTAKALMSNESDTTPRNSTELITLATQLAQDLCDSQNVALDELYPGTYAWEPEGYHDILWTYSADRRLAGTRVFRGAWNQLATNFQHSATSIPRGVGGLSVALTVRDSQSTSGSAGISRTATGLNSGSYSATFTTVDNLPTQNRWRGLVGGTSGERVLFDGTSGGINTNTVTVAWRGIDGTPMQDWVGAVSVQLVEPQVNYGTNLITQEKGKFIYPAQWTSGGIQGLHDVPQLQTVQCLTGSGTLVLGTGGTSGTAGTNGLLTHWSGVLNIYDQVGQTFPEQEYVWLIERNEQALASGTRYDGQFVGHSKTIDGNTAPLYLVSLGGDGGGGLPLRVTGGPGPNPLALSGNLSLTSRVPDLFDDQFCVRLTASVTEGAGTIFTTGKGLMPTTFPFMVRVNNCEDMNVTAINAAGTTWTVTRAQNGFAATTHVEGAYVCLLAAVTTTLAAGIDDATTALTVANAGGGFPAHGFPTDGWYLILVEAELMLVQGGAGTTSWTVERGVNGTTKVAHGLGATVRYLTPGTARYRDLHFVGYTFAQPGRFPGEGFINEPAQLYREATDEANDGKLFPAYTRRWNPSTASAGTDPALEDGEQIWLWKPGTSDTDTDETCLARMIGWAQGRKVYAPDCCCGATWSDLRNCTQLREAIDSSSTTLKVHGKYYQTRATPYKLRIDSEVVNVTAKATDSSSDGANLTVERAANSTTAAEHKAYTPACLLAAVATTLNGPVAAAATTATVTNAGSFPSIGQFQVEVAPGTANREVWLVTAGAGTTTWTISRAQLGTTAVEHTSSVDVVLLSPQQIEAPTRIFTDHVLPQNGGAIVWGPSPIEVIGSPDASGFYQGYRLRWDPLKGGMVRDIPIEVGDLSIMPVITTP